MAVLAPLLSCMTGKDWFWSFVTRAEADIFVLELAAGQAVIAPKGQEDEFCQPVVDTQGCVLFSSALCLQGFRWLTLGSAKSPPKSQLCCSRSGFVCSVKRCPFDIMVRKAWTELSRFHSIPRGGIQDYLHLHILGGITNTNACSAFPLTRFIGIMDYFHSVLRFSQSQHSFYIWKNIYRN